MFLETDQVPPPQVITHSDFTTHPQPCICYSHAFRPLVCRACTEYGVHVHTYIQVYIICMCSASVVIGPGSCAPAAKPSYVFLVLDLYICVCVVCSNLLSYLVLLVDFRMIAIKGDFALSFPSPSCLSQPNKNILLSSPAAACRLVQHAILAFSHQQNPPSC